MAKRMGEVAPMEATDFVVLTDRRYGTRAAVAVGQVQAVFEAVDPLAGCGLPMHAAHVVEVSEPFDEVLARLRHGGKKT